MEKPEVNNSKQKPKKTQMPTEIMKTMKDMQTQFNKGIETLGKTEAEVNLDMGNSISLKQTTKSVESVTHAIEGAEDGMPGLKIK